MNLSEIKTKSLLKFSTAFLFIALIAVRIDWVMYLAQFLFFITVLIDFYVIEKIEGYKFVYITLTFSFLTWCIVSLLWSPDLNLALDALRSLAQMYFIETLLLIMIHTQEDLDFILRCWVWAGWAILLYIAAATPFSEWKDMIFGDYSLGTAAGRLGPTIGMQTNLCGSVLALLILVGIYFFHKTHQKRYILQISLLFVCLLFTKSRTSLFMCAAGLFLYFVLYKKISTGQFLRILLLVAFLIGASIFSVKNPILYQLYGRRIVSLWNYLNGTGVTDASVTGRNVLIQKALEVFGNHPIVGTGIGNFRYFNDSGLAGYYAHNNYVEILADTGIIGGLLYYSAIAVTGVLILRKILKTPDAGRPLLAMSFSVIVMRLIGDYGQVSYLYDSYQLMMVTLFVIAAGGSEKVSEQKSFYIRETRSLSSSGLKPLR